MEKISIHYKKDDYTPIELIPNLIEKAKIAQNLWKNTSIKKRKKIFLSIREQILNKTNEIAKTISEENGKPEFESITHEILPVLELISVYSKRAEKLLQKKRIPLRWMKNKKSYIEYWPKGVVAIISPWNFPFSIPFGEIIMALLAGNAVIFKPSEISIKTAKKIIEILENSLLPKDLVQLVIGEGEHGSQIIKSKVDHVCFTGSVATGKKVMKSCAENLTSVTLELGGKDPMIILDDADLELASSAALWGSFCNSGQACASVERIIIHESIYNKFIEKLVNKTKKLRQNFDLKHTDLGITTYKLQLDVYENHLNEIKNDNSIKFFTGGLLDKEKRILTPTIVGSDDDSIEQKKIYTEETFGPVIAITKFKNIKDAIEKANNSSYGLNAYVFTKNFELGKQIASELEFGTVVINDVMYTHALAETPWGGVKNSGIGRVHSDYGFYEFLNIRHINYPSKIFPQIKNFWWFPYSFHQYEFFKHLLEVLYRKSILRKIKAIPNLIFELILMLKKEKRF
jgi:succinate-semialdehyde dehydrogenase/glutarate-semialdehyde dehydrogenase